MENSYENLDLNTLQSVEITSERGIYFLYRGKEIVYIGKAKNLINRLKDHLYSNKEFDSYKFLPIRGNLDIVLIEAFYISKYRPRYNTYHIESDPSCIKTEQNKRKKYYKSYKENLERKISITFNILK